MSSPCSAHTHPPSSTHGCSGSPEAAVISQRGGTTTHTTHGEGFALTQPSLSETRLSQSRSRAPPPCLGALPETRGIPHFLNIPPARSFCVSPGWPHALKSSILSWGGHAVRAHMGDGGTPRPSLPPPNTPPALTRMQHDPTVGVACLPHARPGPYGQQRGDALSPRHPPGSTHGCSPPRTAPNPQHHPVLPGRRQLQ